MEITDLEGLTDRQKVFVLAYVGECAFNATQAAKAAGYGGDDNTLASTGWDNLRKPEIAAFVREYLGAKAATAEECLARLTSRARATMASAFRQDGDTWVLDIDSLFQSADIHNVKRIKQGPHGWEIELYDALAADVILLRAFEKLSPAGSGEPSVIEVPANGR